jgi:hypothetical protein
MTWFHREPTLSEILADPITKAVMKADSVDLHELEALLRKLAARSHAARTHTSTEHNVNRFQ